MKKTQRPEALQQHMEEVNDLRNRLSMQIAAATPEQRVGLKLDVVFLEEKLNALDKEYREEVGLPSRTYRPTEDRRSKIKIE